MMPNDHIAKADVSEDWCLRCQERENAADPSLPLPDARHEAFARHLVIGAKKPMEAYQAAGFNSRQKHVRSRAAAALQRRMHVQNRIRFLQTELIKIDAKTRTWVDDTLREIVERTMQGKKHLGKDGRPDGDWVFDAANAHKALFSMGKDRGMFVDKLEVRSIDAELHGKTDEEVLEVVCSSLAELGRPICIQMMEKVFGLKYGSSGGSEGSDGGDPSPEKPVSPLH
jgi:hypothetical protein